MSKWETVKISDVTFFQEGPGVRNTQYTTDGVKLLNVANLQNGKLNLSTSDRYISEDEANGKYKHFLVDNGDLIIASSGIKVDYFDKKMGFAKKEHLPLCMNTSTIRFKSLDEERFNLNFFMYYLKSIDFKKQLEKQIVGSAQLNFGSTHLKKMIAPLPPLETQKKIADELDKITGLIEKRKSQIEKLDLLTKAKFVEMFGDPVTNEMGWEKVKLSNLGELGRGVSKHRPRNDPKLLNGDYPLIQTSEVANAKLYINTYTNTYSDLGLKQSKMWKKGTLCITIAANIAKTAILTFDACFPDSIVGFSSNERTNQMFIHFWFAFFQQILEAQAPESAQKNINLKILSDLDVITPPFSLQNKFAEYVEEIEKTRYNMEKGLKQLEVLYKERMQEYFE